MVAALLVASHWNRQCLWWGCIDRHWGDLRLCRKTGRESFWGADTHSGQHLIQIYHTRDGKSKCLGGYEGLSEVEELTGSCVSRG